MRDNFLRDADNFLRDADNFLRDAVYSHEVHKSLNITKFKQNTLEPKYLKITTNNDLS